MKKLIFLVALTAMASFVRAETRWIVPAAPGLIDSAARIVATAMREPVTIENKPGGGAVIGLNAVALAPGEDTFAFASVSSVTLAPHLAPALADVLEKLEAVAYVADTGLLVVTRADSPIKDFKGLLAHAKTTRTPFGHFGPGSLAHVAGELMARQQGVQLTPVAYKGSVAVIQDVLGGHIPVGFVGISTAMPHIKEGRLRAIGASGVTPGQLAALSLPSFTAQGFPAYDNLGGGLILLGKRGISADAKQRMRADVATALRDPKVAGQLADGGIYVRDNPEPSALMGSWHTMWGSYLQSTGLMAALRH